MSIMLIVKGVSSRGKTPTLNKLIDCLLDGKAPIRQEPHPNCVDKMVITERNGMKIGIITLGDPGYTDYVSKKIEFFLEEGVDFIVAASRTYGEIYDTLVSFAGKNGFVVIETGTVVLTSEKNEDKENVLNRICAENILNIIDHANEIEK